MTEREDRKMKSLALAPHATIWLSEEEQIATANACRKDEDNPFVNGDLELLTPATVVANRRPIGFSEHPQPDQATATQADAGAGDPGGDTGGTPEGSLEPAGGEPEPASAEEPPKAAEEPEAAPEGARNRTKAESEASAREAASRRRAPAPTEAEAARGSRAATEEIATPGAVGK
jgi:hypothetical protein